MRFIVAAIISLMCSEVALSVDLSLAPLPETDEEAEVLIGGKPVGREQFPATVYARSGGSCTATVVGPRALAIAAHCVKNGGTVKFSLINRQSYRAKCTHTSKYRRNKTADWAMCLIDREVKGIPFERVNTKGSRLKIGQRILLTGFGCTRRGGGGGNDGTYRAGYSEIRRLPRGSNHDIVTKGGAALCFGDSGGPAFIEDGGIRYQISINSRGNIRDTSYLSALHTKDALNFLTYWANKYKQPICGIHSQATGCRGQAAPDPGPDPRPEPEPQPDPAPEDPPEEEEEDLNWFQRAIVWLVDKILDWFSP